MKLFLNQNQIGNGLIKHKNTSYFIIVVNSIILVCSMVESLVQLYNIEDMSNKISISNEMFSGRNGQISTQIIVFKQLCYK